MATTSHLSTDNALARLRQSVHAKAGNFYSMYSSVLGGIVTDPALMVLPLDDHMVHRGHSVFDTATLTRGMLYQLDPHLDRFLRSAELARIPLPVPRERLRQIILDTAAASGHFEGSVRYWLSAGPGGYGLGPAECIASSFYVIVFKQEAYPENYYTEGIKVVTSQVPIKPPLFARIKSTNFYSTPVLKLKTAPTMASSSTSAGCGREFQHERRSSPRLPSSPPASMPSFPASRQRVPIRRAADAARRTQKSASPTFLSMKGPGRERC
jgi:hypothetical protein